MKVRISLREALSDDRLLGQAIPGESWAIWRALLLASMGETLTPEERELFTLVTGRSQEPQERVDEFWGICGRRSGKTRGAGVLASYLATCVDWRDVLAPGERGAFPVLAASVFQATRAFMHISGILQNSPDLSEMIEGEPTADTIRLSSLVDIVITPASFKTVRGITAVGGICDEVAFWNIEGTRNPDTEILNALRPSLATTGAPLIVISSPYARRGVIYEAFKNDYGPSGDPLILVVKGASKVLNPTLSDRFIQKAYSRNPAEAAAEYDAQFRTDVETLLARETVEGAVDQGVMERPRQAGVTYFGFVDPSGGSGGDSMTMCIAHKEDNCAVIDVLRERAPPYSPEAVTKEFSEVFRSYGISSITGDNFAVEWSKEPFRRQGVEYQRSAAPKTTLYQALVPALNSGRVALLDNERAVKQLCALERRAGNSGRDIIDHPKGNAFHDDVANAIAGAVYLVIGNETMASYGLFEVMRREAEARELENPIEPILPEYAPGSVEHARGLRPLPLED